MEKMLKGELETLGKAWSKLEDQNTRKVLSLGAKEEQIAKLAGEVPMFLILFRNSD